MFRMLEEENNTFKIEFGMMVREIRGSESIKSFARKTNVQRAFLKRLEKGIISENHKNSMLRVVGAINLSKEQRERAIVLINLISPHEDLEHVQSRKKTLFPRKKRGTPAQFLNQKSIFFRLPAYR